MEVRVKKGGIHLQSQVKFVQSDTFEYCVKITVPNKEQYT